MGKKTLVGKRRTSRKKVQKGGENQWELSPAFTDLGEK